MYNFNMSIWSNAFKINKGRELTEEEKIILTKAVKKIKERKLEDIAFLMIEATRPVHTIINNLVYFSQPAFNFIFSRDEIEKLIEILDNPKACDFLKEKLGEKEEK